MKKRLFYVLSLAIIVLNIVPVAKVYAAETKFEWVNQEAVSYTHLDVYKRQVCV